MVCKLNFIHMQNSLLLMIIVGKSAMEHGINNHIDDLIICVSGSSRRQNITDIRHAGHIEYKPLEAQSEPRMPCAVSASCRYQSQSSLQSETLQRLLEHSGRSRWLPPIISRFWEQEGPWRQPSSVVILTHIKSLMYGDNRLQNGR